MSSEKMVRVLQAGGHIPPDNPLGQALGDGGFTHAWLADEHRVVFGLPGEDADHIADLRIPADTLVSLWFRACSTRSEPYFFKAS